MEGDVVKKGVDVVKIAIHVVIVKIGKSITRVYDEIQQLYRTCLTAAFKYLYLNFSVFPYDFLLLNSIIPQKFI